MFVYLFARVSIVIVVNEAQHKKFVEIPKLIDMLSTLKYFSTGRMRRLLLLHALSRRPYIYKENHTTHTEEDYSIHYAYLTYRIFSPFQCKFTKRRIFIVHRFITFHSTLIKTFVFPISRTVTNAL